MHRFGFIHSSILGKSYRSFCESLPWRSSEEELSSLLWQVRDHLCVCVCLGVCMCVCVCLSLLGCSMSIWQHPHLIINNRFVREKRSRPLRHVVTLKTAVPLQFERHCFKWWLACSCCVGSLSGSHLLRDFSNSHHFCFTKHLSLLKQQQRCLSRDGKHAHCGTFKGCDWSE